MSVLEMNACSRVLLIVTVGRWAPFQRTLELPLKFEPLTVSVKPAPPAVTLLGEILVITGPLAALTGAVQPKISIATTAANVTTSRRFIIFRAISSQDIIRLVVCPDRLGSVAGVLYQKSCWIHGGIMRCGKEVSRLVRGAKKGRGGYTGQDLSNWPGSDGEATKGPTPEDSKSS